MSQLADLLSSRVKAEVFRLLFGMNDEPLHLREMERRSGLAVGTVRQELKKLEGLGLVQVRADGNRTSWSADQSHPLYAEIRGLVMKTDGLADVLRPAVAGRDVSLAFVFGSMAGGKTSAASDIDLMVVGTLGLRRLAEKLSGMGTALGREINPHVMTSEEFVRRRKAEDHFLSTVLAGPVLFLKGGPDELEAMG